MTVIWLDPGDMNTRMHQEAFPGEDISDRAAAGDIVPTLIGLVERGQSGGYRGDQVLEPA